MGLTLEEHVLKFPYTHKKTCITSGAGKGVISEFSYSLDNREDTNLTLNYISPCGHPSSIVSSPSLCLMLDELDNPN